MPPSDGWYLFGPLLALVLVGVLSVVLRWELERDRDALREWPLDGFDLFGEPEDYGLLSAAALAEDAEVAQEVRRMLAAVGIRSTIATGSHGQVRVLVFAEDVDVARRLVGGSPERQ
ncbi:MAG TPA: hypothetical protein VF755_23180 [Catenuloplanes sp.]|jgi:hypothetical protein